MGAFEEGAKAARTFMESMRVQPLALAMIVINLLLLGYLFWSGHETTIYRNEYLRETQKLLASCVHVDDLERLLMRAREK